MTLLIAGTMRVPVENLAAFRPHMLAMIAAGLAPSDFVGLGIVYSGDRANPSGRGAITDVRPCSWYKYTITVTLEDGRQSRLNPVSFTEHLGNRYKTDFKRHGAPYLAELAAGGAAYTLGVVFYAADHRIPHGHGLWHLFVLAGSACHFTTVLVYVA